MELENAKRAVIEAGVQLVRRGLIQRTWGNVSCRVDDNRFVITPSGRDYLSLTPEQIVLVNIADLSYEGEIKPSSEKGIHAQCYALRPEVNFVIHTHQTYASLLGMSGFDINGITGEAATVIGTDVPLAAYGLPGTKKLRKGVTDALKRSASKAVLMHRHGALCVGTDMDDAFRVANTLEELCKEKLSNRFYELTGKAADSFVSIAEYVAANLQTKAADIELDAFDSVREYGVAQLTPAQGGETIPIDIDTGVPLDPAVPCPDTAALHTRIYQTRKDVNAIVHSKEPATLAASKTGLTVRPFLDDFAQIVGLTLRTAVYDPEKARKSAKQVVKKMRFRDAVLLEHNGAVCVGSSADEANAVKLVTEKGCKAFVAADIFGRNKDRINLCESLLMHVVYKAKYAKKK